MLTDRPKNEIPIVLTNTSTLASSTVSLFSLGSNSTSGNINGSSASVDGLQIEVNDSDFLALRTWRFAYDSVPNYYLIGNPTSIDNLISSLNARFGDVFWKEDGGAVADWYLRVASSQYIFSTVIITGFPNRTFTSFASGFIAGTTIRATSEIDVTYPQITTDLTTQPYIITTIYVFSTDATQNSASFTIVETQPNGTSKNRPYKPQLLPTQHNTTQYNIPIYMPTSAYNELQYTLAPSATVNMIVRYEHVDLFDALTLMDSDEFKAQMAILKERDEVEFKRIMKVVTGEDIVDETEGAPTWNGQEPTPTKKAPLIKAVPLIFVVHKENGNSSISML